LLRPGLFEALLGALPVFPVPQNVVPLPARVSLLSRICAVTVYLDLQAIASSEACITD